MLPAVVKSFLIQVLKEVNPDFGIALSDLAKSLVLITTLLDVLGMEQVLLCLLSIIPNNG